MELLSLLRCRKKLWLYIQTSLRTLKPHTASNKNSLLQQYFFNGSMFLDQVYIQGTQGDHEVPCSCIFREKSIFENTKYTSKLYA